jgi:hypothetical protein
LSTTNILSTIIPTAPSVRVPVNFFDVNYRTNLKEKEKIFLTQKGN